MSAAPRYWLKLGFISFGGPAGQISMRHHELVEKRGWISEHRYLHALNYCVLLPGPEAIQPAIYISWLLHGVRGAMSRVLKNAVLFGIAALAFIGIFFFDVGFPWIVLAAAILGAIAAFVAWFPFKIDITKVIGACALIGLAHSLAT